MNLHDRDIKKAAREEGISIGLQQGEQKKAVEAAILLVNKHKESPEDAAKEMNAPLDLVLQKLQENTAS